MTRKLRNCTLRTLERLIAHLFGRRGDPRPGAAEAWAHYDGLVLLLDPQSFEDL
jgi:hypothetical protein